MHGGPEIKRLLNVGPPKNKKRGLSGVRDNRPDSKRITGVSGIT